MQDRIAFLEVTVEQGKFVKHNGVNVQEFDSNHLVGNGWKATISEEGKITCRTSEKSEDGVLRAMKFVIHKNGKVIQTLKKTGERRSKQLNTFILKGWQITGVLGFPNANDEEIHHRYMYFRTEEQK